MKRRKKRLLIMLLVIACLPGCATETQTEDETTIMLQEENILQIMEMQGMTKPKLTELKVYPYYGEAISHASTIVVSSEAAKIKVKYISSQNKYKLWYIKGSMEDNSWSDRFWSSKEQEFTVKIPRKPGIFLFTLYLTDNVTKEDVIHHVALEVKIEDKESTLP